MKAKFWDVKAGVAVEAEVIDAVSYANGGFAYKAKTKDGRNLTRFIKEADYKAFKKGCKK